MSDGDVQREFWDGAAASKTFTHPVPLAALRGLLSPDARILDYGCGYGRTVAELARGGFRNVVGIDISSRLIERGRGLHPDLDLRVFDGGSTGLADGSFDACLLIAVLNGIPSDAGEERTVAEVRRLLRPGGILFLSDYPLQTDARSLERYREFEAQTGVYGVFRAGGGTFRHHDARRVAALLSGFDVVWEAAIRVRTMNGNEADAFQLAARKGRS